MANHEFQNFVIPKRHMIENTLNKPKTQPFSIATTMKTTVFLAMASSAAAFHQKCSPVTGDVIKGEYIVTLKSTANLSKSLGDVFSMDALNKIRHVYGNYDGATFKGFSLEACDEKLASQIADMDDVLAIEPNQVVHAFDVQTDPVWGLDRIDQASPSLDGLYYYKESAGVGVDMYTLDTGIRYTHQEFENRAQFYFSAFGDDGVDRQGHGTHVSSTMAGAQYGVAKRSNLFGVKVLGDNGSGAWSGVIAGVDRVNAASSTRTKVANMSLGGTTNNALDAAINAATDVIYVVASGNSGRDACGFSPASATNAYAVNSIQEGDTKSSFSNFGRCTDIFAPGTNVQAAWHTSDQATNTISGTSMASPHVAGVAALLVSDSASLSVQQVKDLLTSLSTKDAINNPGGGSPNALVYNGGDGPSTPSPPTPPPTPPPTVCASPGQLCQIDGSSDPCCEGYGCEGTVNWATCQVTSGPPPTNPPNTPTTAPPTPTTAPPTAGPPPTECIAEGLMCSFVGGGVPCCTGNTCTGTEWWATCNPDAQLA
jgi:subtilisin family serine protease